jgi:hypothetical protein
MNLELVVREIQSVFDRQEGQKQTDTLDRWREYGL